MVAQDLGVADPYAKLYEGEDLLDDGAATPKGVKDRLMHAAVGLVALGGGLTTNRPRVFAAFRSHVLVFACLCEEAELDEALESVVGKGDGDPLRTAMEEHTLAGGQLASTPPPKKSARSPSADASTGQ
eukprot:7091502-Alexandrium_andersonii.AAC.1